MELINRHSNTELLKDAPHRLFLDDLAIVVRCLIEAADDGTPNFLVHDSHMKLWGIFLSGYQFLPFIYDVR